MFNKYFRELINIYLFILYLINIFPKKLRDFQPFLNLISEIMAITNLNLNLLYFNQFIIFYYIQYFQICYILNHLLTIY